VWATKYRRPVIIGSVETDFKKDIFEIAEDLGIGIIAMETMPDHIHMLVDCRPQLCISDAVKVLKGTSAWRLFRSHPEIKSQLWGGHLWNPSYFVATVSDRTREQVETYIRGQRTKRGVGGRPRKKR
jgi:putative transposase